MATKSTQSNRRKFLKTAPVVAAAAAVAAAPAVARAQATTDTSKGSYDANGKPTKKVLWSGGKKPEKQALFSPAVSYGNLLFISGIGAHFEGDIKAHTEHVLNEIKKNLE